MISIDSTTPQVFGLLLAAGRSRRFGGDKRRALLPCGRSLLQASLDNARAAFCEVWVVLREDDNPHALGIPGDVRIVRCADADLGMGHSLASGIGALLPSSAVAVAVLLADMPWIGTDTLLRLATMADAERIAVPVHEGQRGHPVIIGRRFWPQLVALQGDQGARAVIAAHAERCEVLECADAGILRDADTAQALQQALKP
ncbi:nucleotidyltransferase family protein [Pseudomonas sp. v388]|uniref:nucleotidyltransferase family protein n=1 Tax=Pseudomonas sp. v388 TaxID=2479849 RepID=UPI000F79CEC6|nr:nucleotidyltransferase family protein [Pseudomonas sp. v388]RRV10352.1 nucleotidyltransferase family protein [Pseudomonas sp. v388]